MIQVKNISSNTKIKYIFNHNNILLKKKISIFLKEDVQEYKLITNKNDPKKSVSLKSNYQNKMWQAASIMINNNVIVGLITVSLRNNSQDHNKDRFIYSHRIYINQSFRSQKSTKEFYDFFLKEFIKDARNRDHRASKLIAVIKQGEIKKIKALRGFLTFRGFKFIRNSRNNDYERWYINIPVQYSF